MPPKPQSRRIRPPTRRQARALAVVTVVAAVILAASGFDQDRLVTYAQLDRGVLLGAGKSSPARTLTHPWAPSSTESEGWVDVQITWHEEQPSAALADAALPAAAETEGGVDAEAAVAHELRPAEATVEPQPAPVQPVAQAPAPPRVSQASQPLPAATPAPARPPEPVAAPTGLSAMEQQLFDIQNAERARAGVAPLRLDAAVQGVARRRASDMATRGYLSHTSPTGETAFSLLDAAGIYSPYAGENIGFNNYADSQSVGSVFAAFMSSPTHRANILNGRFTRVGVAVAYAANGMKYYAVVFAGP